jgi:hypothetical protein
MLYATPTKRATHIKTKDTKPMPKKICLPPSEISIPKQILKIASIIAITSVVLPQLPLGSFFILIVD